MTEFLQILTCVVVVVSYVSCQSPNLVFVLVDDVGWSDVNYTSGGVSSLPTPHLDNLSAGGLRLSSHYVQPTCTPSRAALMTGQEIISNSHLTVCLRSICSQHGTLLRDVPRERGGAAGRPGHHAGVVEGGGLLRTHGRQVAPVNILQII